MASNVASAAASSLVKPVAIDPLEKETMRRVARRLIPLLMISYFAAYLDRVNVGFAALTMNKALGFSAEIFGIGSGIFFVGYFLFEIPSNLILSKVGARRWIARILDHLGHHLRGDRLRHRNMVVLRHPLPAGPRRGRLLSRHHPVSDLVVPVGVPLADHRHLHDGDPDLDRHRLAGIRPDPAPWAPGAASQAGSGCSSWRPSQPIMLGFVVMFYLTDGPEHAHWLRPGQRDWLVDRLAAERSQSEAIRHYSLAETMRNPRVWLLTLVYFGQNVTGYGLVIFPAADRQPFGVGVGYERPDQRPAVCCGRVRDGAVGPAFGSHRRASVACRRGLFPELCRRWRSASSCRDPILMMIAHDRVARWASRRLHRRSGRCRRPCCRAPRRRAASR